MPTLVCMFASAVNVAWQAVTLYLLLFKCELFLCGGIRFMMHLNGTDSSYTPYKVMQDLFLTFNIFVQYVCGESLICSN